MTPSFKIQNFRWLLFLTLITTSLSFAQRDVEKWKLLIALGVNNTRDQPETYGFYSKQINFPTVNLGLQHMFSRTLGAKFDVGFNRSSHAETSDPYKLNYNRVNIQGVYDFKDVFTFLPRQISIVAHAGPGLSMTKPLGNYANNTYNFLNLLGGAELHYKMSKTLSIYVDGSYVYSLANKNDFYDDGFSFNGDMAYVTFGVAISLNRCNYCSF